jgi:pyruvate-formate lyase
MEHKNWTGFKTNLWQDEINVKDFILTNYQEYVGDDSFLVKATDRTNKLMEKVQDALTDAFHKDPIAVLTGIYTGDGERNWVFYTLSTNIFGRKLNEALQSFELLPITIYCENDPEWNEYDEMKDLSEIQTED